jgi:CNT family concentrative nucleoside transporter
MSTAGHPIKDDDPKENVMQQITSSSSSYEKKDADDPEALAKFQTTEEESAASIFYAKARPYILGGFAAAILGWWISATVLPATRHRWYAFIFLFSSHFLNLIGSFKHCLRGHL